VLIYEMLTGYPPFLDDDALATYKKILKGNLTFPPHLSVTARDLIRKLLQVVRLFAAGDSLVCSWEGCQAARRIGSGRLH
jgi:serine/threonine protein kinase